jgi:molybdate transport system permease protein
MYEAIFLSLKVTGISTLITSFLGIITAYIFSKHEFRGKSIIETIFLMPIALPPTVVGYLIMLGIGKKSIFGQFIYKNFGINILFTWQAACIAAIVVSFPLIYQNAKNAFTYVEEEIKDAARVDGADELKLFWFIIIPVALNGIIGGVILAFVRALGEFGATLIVAGNIPGQTQTIPLLIYFSIGSGDNRTANILVILIMIISMSLVLITNRLLKRNETSKKSTE